MSANNNDTSERQIITTRILNAPRELVWTVWTDPKHVAIWWGPRGFTNTFTEFNMTVGGKWKFVMHGPDGRDYKNMITFLEVLKPEKLVYAHGGESEDKELEDVHFVNTVTFTVEEDKTRVTMNAVFGSKEQRDYVVKEYGAEEGGKQTLAKLAEYLETM